MAAFPQHCAAALALLAPPTLADAGEVLSNPKISATQGGLTAGVMENFGSAVARLDDMDGDGVPELAIGEEWSDDGGFDRGAVWIVFLNADGTVKHEQKISSTAGNFGGALDDEDEFGASVAFIGDTNGDGIGDIAVGAPEDDDGGTGCGAIYILRLDVDGTVKGHQKISNLSGGLSLAGPALDPFDRFGSSLAWMGDFADNGVFETLAVGAPFDDDGATLEDRGAIWLLTFENSGFVQTKKKISTTQGAFTGPVDDYDWLGSSLAYLGDIDGDGVGDLAAGAMRDDDGGVNRGAVWVLFLFPNGTVKGFQKISASEGNFAGALSNGAEFGSSATGLTDLDGDGVAELVIGTPRDSDGGSNRGAAWVLFLDDDGQVHAHQKISDTEGGFTGFLQNFDVFGGSLGALGDFDGDGRDDLIVGAHGDDDGGGNYGAIYLLTLDGVPSASAEIYGCGLNPEGSLELAAPTLPTLGATMRVGLRNLLGTQNAGAASFLMTSLGPWPAFPCGLPMPDAGMGGPGFPGEFLLDPTQLIITLSGPPWPGGDSLAVIPVPIPTNTALLGLEVFAQGLLVDPASIVQFGLTEGLALRIGA